LLQLLTKLLPARVPTPDAIQDPGGHAGRACSMICTMRE
jgi:hypothetical protein